MIRSLHNLHTMKLNSEQEVLWKTYENASMNEWISVLSIQEVFIVYKLRLLRLEKLDAIRNSFDTKDTA